MREQKTKKYEIRDRIFSLKPLVTEASLIELPEEEVIIGIDAIKGTTSKFCIWTAKEVLF